MTDTGVFARLLENVNGCLRGKCSYGAKNRHIKMLLVIRRTLGGNITTARFDFLDCIRISQYSSEITSANTVSGFVINQFGFFSSILVNQLDISQFKAAHHFVVIPRDNMAPHSIFYTIADSSFKHFLDFSVCH